MVYPALLPLMRTPRLPVVDWTGAPADLNGLVRFAERRNLVSAPTGVYKWYCVQCCCAALHTIICTLLFRGKMHSDWFNGIDILQVRWQHGEKVGYRYPSRLEKTLCKWDIYVPLVTKGLIQIVQLVGILNGACWNNLFNMCKHWNVISAAANFKNSVSHTNSIL